MSLTWTRLDAMDRLDLRLVAAGMIEEIQVLPATIERQLLGLESICHGLPINQLQHALQAATLAYNDNASDELVFCALVHDIGKVLSWQAHEEIVATLTKPHVSVDANAILRHHQDFLAYHTRAIAPQRANARDAHRGERWYDQAIVFSDWDQRAFDPHFNYTMKLPDFRELIHSMLGPKRARKGDQP